MTCNPDDQATTARKPRIGWRYSKNVAKASVYSLHLLLIQQDDADDEDEDGGRWWWSVNGGEAFDGDGQELSFASGHAFTRKLAKTAAILAARKIAHDILNALGGP